MKSYVMDLIIRMGDFLAGGRPGTGIWTVSHAGQVKGDDPDEKGYSGPPGGG
jgi:hypothetical protein